MKETKGFIAEFKAFIARGNVLDMAVGIIIGSAFTAIVTSLVNNIIMPIVGVIIGGIDFSGLKVTVGSAFETLCRRSLSWRCNCRSDNRFAHGMASV